MRFVGRAAKFTSKSWSFTFLGEKPPHYRRESVIYIGSWKLYWRLGSPLYYIMILFSDRQCLLDKVRELWLIVNWILLQVSEIFFERTRSIFIGLLKYYSHIMYCATSFYFVSKFALHLPIFQPTSNLSLL